MLYERFPAGERGRIVAAARRSRAQGNLRGSGRSAGASAPSCGSATARRRPADAKRRAILGDMCEAIIGAVYLDGGSAAAAAVVRAAFGRAHVRAAPRRCATPRPRCRNGRRRAGWRRRATGSQRAADPTMRRNSWWRSRSKACRRRRRGTLEARGRAGGRRGVPAREGIGRPPRSRAIDRATRSTDDALRLRRSGRRAQRRQVDAAQALVGTKVSIVSRKAQTTRALVRGIAHRGRGAAHLRRHARHFRAQAPARPRHGGERHGRRRRRRRGRAARRRRAAASTPRCEAIVAKLATLSAPKILVAQQDRSRSPRDSLAGADGGAQRRRRISSRPT